MNYKLLIFILLFVYSCAQVQKKNDVSFKEVFSNSGFSLVYNKDLNSGVITKKIDDIDNINWSKKITLFINNIIYYNNKLNT